MLTTSAPETVNPVSDQCESAHVPCLGTIVPWESWFLGRGGTIGTTAATSSSFKYTYLYFIGLEDELAGQIPAWKELKTNHKVGGLWPSDADGTAFRGAFTKALPGDGYKVINPGAYSDGATDFTTIINKYKSSGVEIVQGCPLPPDFATFWKQCQLAWGTSRGSPASPRPSCSPAWSVRPRPARREPAHRRVVDAGHAVEVLLRRDDLPAVRERVPGGDRPAVDPADVVQLRGVRDRRARAAVGRRPARSPGGRGPDRQVQGEVITGSYDFTSGPVKNVAVHDDFAGQWQKSKDPKFMYDLYVVNNAMDSSVPVTAALKSL